MLATKIMTNYAERLQVLGKIYFLSLAGNSRSDRAAVSFENVPFFQKRRATNVGCRASVFLINNKYPGRQTEARDESMRVRSNEPASFTGEKWQDFKSGTVSHHKNLMACLSTLPCLRSLLEKCVQQETFFKEITKNKKNFRDSVSIRLDFCFKSLSHSDHVALV